MISFIKLLCKNDAIRACVVLATILFALPTYKAIAVDAAILPQGVTQFLDDDGNPLSTGKVYFYVPNTLTFKTTWQNAAKSITNTNPVDLDAGGRAIIYGDGSYRQIVKDNLGNTIYDAVTTAPLTGGSATLVGDGNLVGTVLPWAGLTAPAQYQFGYGQEIARVTYPDFFTAITSTQTVGCTLGSPTITGLSDTSQIIVGTAVELSCVAAGTTVLSKTLTTAVLSANSSASTSASATFFPWGNGNGTTTFNVPDLRGYNLAGRDNMGGTASARLVNGNGLGRPLGIANFTYIASDAASTIQRCGTGLTCDNSSHTYTQTSVAVTRIKVSMVAGGGGGGARVTNNGADGNNTVFGSWTVIKGSGGQNSGGGVGGGAGGTGGADSTGTLIIRVPGGAGGAGGGSATASTSPPGGFGGSSAIGGGVVGSVFNGSTGAAAATATGNGGQGGAANSVTSAGGGGAGEYAEFYVDCPCGTTYTVGFGGAGGAAGTIAGGAGAGGNMVIEEYYTPTPSTTSFTATTAGTLEQQRTINYVVKVTPDTSASSATGVASLGGMTGVITCGTSLLCTGNIVSVTTVGVTIGGTGTGTQFTSGSVVFAGTSGVYNQNNASFFWDNSNSRLGIGTASPSVPLHIANSTGGDLARIQKTGSGTTTSYMISDGSGSDGRFGMDGSGNLLFVAAASRTFRLFTNNTENLIVDTTGNLLLANGYVTTKLSTVVGLPTCNSASKSARSFVTDSNAASFTAGIGAIVAAGGTTNVPVVCDGTNWRIG